MPLVVSLFSLALLGSASASAGNGFLQVTAVKDAVPASGTILAGAAGVHEMIAVGNGLAAISGTVVSLFDAETLQAPEGRRPSGILRSSEELRSLVQIPTLGHGIGLMAGTAVGHIHFFKTVSMSAEQAEPFRVIDFCNGSALPITKLSHVAFDSKHFLLASSDSSQGCGVQLFDVEGNLKQSLAVAGQVVSHRLLEENKVVLVVNVGKDCVLMLYGYRHGTFVEGESLRLENTHCGKDITINSKVRLLSFTTISCMASTANLVHVDMDSWSRRFVLNGVQVATGVSHHSAGSILASMGTSVAIVDVEGGGELQQLDMSDHTASSAVSFRSKGKSWVAVGLKDGSIRLFDVPAPVVLSDEQIWYKKKRTALCLTADDEDTGPLGYAALNMKACDGHTLSDNHQHWKDIATGLWNANLGQCLAGFDTGENYYVTFADPAYGCIPRFSVGKKTELWYTNFFRGQPASYACVVEDDVAQWALKYCGSSISDCDKIDCVTGWHETPV